MTIMQLTLTEIQEKLEAQERFIDVLLRRIENLEKRMLPKSNTIDEFANNPG